MKYLFFFLVLHLLNCCWCNEINNENGVTKLFEDINKNVVKFNAISADIEWESSTKAHNLESEIKSTIHQNKWTIWQHKICEQLRALQNRLMLNTTQQRQAFLLCRGPVYTFKEIRSINELNEKLLSNYYDFEICIPRKIFKENETKNALENNIIAYLSSSKHQMELRTFKQNYDTKDNKMCLRQKDLEELAAHSTNENVLRWVWLTWRAKAGYIFKHHYSSLVSIENKAARSNGYADLGESWREELEIPNLRFVCRQLYSSIQPLYELLHGVVRYFLRIKYGDVVPENGPIPAHLLGNLWIQNWESLADVIIPNAIDLDANMKVLKWDVKHMLKRAEDFYLSLTLPPMTESFWLESVFTDVQKDNVRCHGTAANMFRKDDYRMLYCSGVSLQDFNVLHHEMGHIQYYMAYENQPGLFMRKFSPPREYREAIMLGVITPQHLNRLGLLNDSLLFLIDEVHPTQPAPNKFKDNRSGLTYLNLLQNSTTSQELLLKRALSKLPQIPFALLIEEYRWKYFEGSLDVNSLNKEFWDMSLQFQGISPPIRRGEEFFDAGAIYHVADNTPYIRYFLSHFLQHQLFEHFCKVSVFGNQRANESLPDTMDVSKCDIYGAKAVGRILKNLMSYGHSENWREILKVTLNQEDISPDPLLRYYQPLREYLTELVLKHNIPVGW